MGLRLFYTGLGAGTRHSGHSGRYWNGIHNYGCSSSCVVVLVAASYCCSGRAGLVQLVSASSLSHQVLGSKPSLCRISAGVRLCFGYSLPQTPLVWEPLTLGLPLFFNRGTNPQRLGARSALFRLPLKRRKVWCFLQK
jgi:hypothetical protein